MQVKNIVTEIQVMNFVTENKVSKQIKYVIPSITVVKTTSFSAKCFSHYYLGV